MQLILYRIVTQDLISVNRGKKGGLKSISFGLCVFDRENYFYFANENACFLLSRIIIY